MRFHLCTLLIVGLLIAWGCAKPPGEAPVQLARAVADASIQVDPPIGLEWTDLAFKIEDRERFDLKQLPERVRRLEGKRVRVRGYFHLGTISPQVQEFLLLGEINTQPTAMKYGPLPDEWSRLPVDQLAIVTMPAGAKATVTQSPVAVTGRLTFKVVEFEGTVVLVYQIAAESVEPVERRLGYGPAITGGC